MKYLRNSPQISRVEGFGYELVLRLKEGWQTPARRIAQKQEGIKRRLSPYVEFGKDFLEQIGIPQDIEIVLGEFGLHHVRFSSDRIGLDLNSERNFFQSHNFSKLEYVYVAQSIVLPFIEDLEHFDN